VALTGPLGSGKTCLVQGICEGLGVDDPVTSPTFVLVNEYRGRDRDGEVTVHHFDLYRLEGAEDLVDLGWDDYLDEGGLCLVEWADRADEVIPSRAIRIAIEAPERCVRLFTLTRED
jgi:tRNA threonylcarbamoyladenosine biosynthesis protein TsaE